LGAAQSAHSWVRELAYQRRHWVRSTTNTNGVRLESDPIVHESRSRQTLRVCGMTTWTARLPRRNPRT
jgi:hypothetical protein